MERIRDALLRVRRTCRDAVMFDIDDTLIDSETGRPLTSIVGILKFCKELSYKVVIMTARSRLSKEYTQQQLQLLDIPYDILMFIPAKNKNLIKRKLGLRFVLSVGDMETDCGESDHNLKLPGKFIQTYGYWSGP